MSAGKTPGERAAAPPTRHHSRHERPIAPLELQRDHATSGAEGKPRDYVVDGTKDTNEALGFLRDWVTAVLQLETAILGAVGAALAFKDAPEMRLSPAQTGVIIVTVLCFVMSVGSGIMLLNMLPGATQRVAVSEEARRRDIYSIHTVGRLTINSWTQPFRWGFFLAMAGMGGFVILRVLKL